MRVWNKDAAHCATTCLCRGLCISAGPVPACGCCALRLFLPRAPVSAACGVSRFAAAARDRRGVAGLACARRVRGANADRTRSGRPSSPYRALPGRAQRDQRSHRFVIKHSLESFRLLASKKLLLSLLVPARLAARSTHTIEVYPHPHRIQPTKSTSFGWHPSAERGRAPGLCALWRRASRSPPTAPSAAAAASAGPLPSMAPRSSQSLEQVELW